MKPPLDIYKTGDAASITYRNPYAVEIEEMAGKDDFTVQSLRRYAVWREKSWKKGLFRWLASIPILLSLSWPLLCPEEMEDATEKIERKCSKGYFSFNGLKNYNLLHFALLCASYEVSLLCDIVEISSLSSLGRQR